MKPLAPKKLRCSPDRVNGPSVIRVAVERAKGKLQRRFARQSVELQLTRRMACRLQKRVCISLLVPTTTGSSWRPEKRLCLRLSRSAVPCRRRAPESPRASRRIRQCPGPAPQKEALQIGKGCSSYDSTSLAEPTACMSRFVPSRQSTLNGANVKRFFTSWGGWNALTGAGFTTTVRLHVGAVRRWKDQMGENPSAA